METPISCILPAEILRQILHYRLFGFGTHVWPVPDRMWHHTPTSRYHFLCVANDIIADVFPAFSADCPVLSIISREDDTPPHGILLSVGYQLAVLRLMVLKYQFTPFPLARISVDLRSLCDSLTLRYLLQLVDAFTTLGQVSCDLPLPALDLSVSYMSPTLQAAILHIGALGYTNLRVNVASLPPDTYDLDSAGPEDPRTWTASMDFPPSHFGTLTTLCLEGALLLDQRGFLSCVLKQECVLRLELQGSRIRPTDWGFLLHAICMPNLRMFTAKGCLRCPHFGEFVRRHSNIHHLQFGPASRWLDENFTLLRIPPGLHTIEGPHDMIAPLFQVYRTMGNLRHLRVYPSINRSILDWDFDMLDQLLDMISRTPAFISLGLDINPFTLAQFIHYLHGRSMHTISVPHLILAQDSPLVVDGICMVRLLPPH
jgi:hypothetical protein